MTQTEWAHLMMKQLVSHGVSYYVFASGYRWTPLILAALQNPNLYCVSHFDERGVGFHALGWAKATGKPALVITTSGSAVANLYPAVIEASMDEVPLIILSADRPEELLNCGANQAIDQMNLFGSYPRSFVNLPVAEDRVQAEELVDKIDEVLEALTGFYAGPVHINAPIREPFEFETTASSRDLITGSIPLRSQHDPAINSRDDEAKNFFPNIQSSNGIIIAASGLSNEDEDAIIALSEELGWPILPDISSSLRLHPRSENVVPYYDQILLNPKAVSCDAVLQFGRRFVSKRLLQWLGGQDLKDYVLVAATEQDHDPARIVTQHIKMTPKEYLSPFLKESGVKSPVTFGATPFGKVGKDLSPFLKGSTHNVGEGLGEWKEHSLAVQKTLDLYFKTTPSLNEISLIRNITEHASPNHAFFIANSMPIRDMDMYAPILKHSIPLGCNRGASGIDGIISTAIGYAQGLQRPVTLITGDLTFLHDVNALAALKKSPYPLCIVVINNDGGGIFSLLPASQQLPTEMFETIYGTPQNIEIKQVAESLGLRAHCVDTMEECIDVYAKAQQSQESVVIEVKTDRAENAKLHQDLREMLR